MGAGLITVHSAVTVKYRPAVLVRVERGGVEMGWLSASTVDVVQTGRTVPDFRSKTQSVTLNYISSYSLSMSVPSSLHVATTHTT